MADFLSEEWFASLNDGLRQAGPVPLEEPGRVLRVVFELSDEPSGRPHAFTFTLRAEGASAEVGDHLAADAVVRLSFDDAAALTSGTLESAHALREGRVKVRGDLRAVVALVGWLQSAHAHLAP